VRGRSDPGGRRSQVRIKVIACEVLFRELCLCASRARHVVDLVFLRRGLHDNPDLLRQRLQSLIEETEAGSCQAIALGYGLCSNGVAGLRAREIPLVLPRAHDCITLLLGSKESYAARFSERPGTYYYSGGWIEREADRVPRRPEDGAGLDLSFEEMVAKYGQDNAEYLWEFTSSWIQNYTHATYIETALGNREQYRAHTQRIARERGWSFDEVAGELSLLQALLDGSWDEGRILVVPPNHEIVPSVGDEVVAARP
jgi:hypothetical protein